jgi:glycosyltransferase involved in cell wall biosynthesis
MRIIYYSPHPTHDIVSEVGYATHQREVILALRNLGHNVFPVIMGGTEEANLNTLATDGYKIPLYKRLIKRILPRFIWTSLNNYKLIRHDIKAGKILEENILKINPDLIYERSEYLQDSGAILANKYKIKYFIEVNAPFIEEMRVFEGYSLFHSKAHKIEAFKLTAADKVFTVSTALKDFLVTRYNCISDKIIVQPNCINPEKIEFDPQLVNNLKGDLKLNTEKVIGFVGSMFPYHGVDILINAFSKVIKEHPGSKLLIVGDGIVLSDLKELTHDLSLDNSVVFTGKIPHSLVFNYIQLMDICIMAKSNWYGSPVKIFEYGLLKKPIIAPDNIPVRDVMVNMQDAILIQENETELKNAICNLLENETFAKSLAINFYNKVIGKYRWSNATETIIQSCG